MLITLILYLKTAGHIFTKVEGYVYQCGKLIHYLVYLWTHITEKSSISHFWNSLMRTLYQHSGSCLFSSAFWFCLPVFAVHSQSLSLQQLKNTYLWNSQPIRKGEFSFSCLGKLKEKPQKWSPYILILDLDPVSILESNYDWTKLWCKKCVVWTKIWPQVHPWIQEQSQFPSIQMNRRVGKRGLPKTKSGPQGVWSDQGPLVIMSRVWTPRKEWQFLLLKILMERKYLVDKYRFSFKHVG